MRFLIYPWLFLGIVFSSGVYSANPFSSLKAPDVPEDPVVTVKEPDPEKPPIQRWPVQNYILMGLLTAETDIQNHKIAILRTPAPHSRTYIVRFGDLLGDRDGYINGFDSSGIKIIQRGDDDAPEEVRLDVRNRGAKQLND